jgi:hypothetical protein
MSSGQNGDAGTGRAEPDFAQVGLHLLHLAPMLIGQQALKDLARGERAAAAMENHLDSLEKKIEELLAKADEDERKLNAQPKASEQPSTREDVPDAA